MIDYQKGKIYKIVSPSTGLTYYGSTTVNLKNRKAKHNYDMKYWKEGKRCYCSSYEVLAHDDAEIYLVEEYPCNNKNELEAKEGWYILNNDCCNKISAGGVVNPKTKNINLKKEWYENNKELCKERAKINRLNNLEQYKKNKAIKVVCECGITTSKNNRAHHLKSKHHQKYVASVV